MCLSLPVGFPALSNRGQAESRSRLRAAIQLRSDLGARSRTFDTAGAHHHRRQMGQNSYDVEVDTSGVGLDLKTQLFSLTGVPPERIKLMEQGGQAADGRRSLADCGLEDLAAKKKKQ